MKLRSQTEWGLVFALIRTTMLQQVASRQGFSLLVSLADDGPEQTVSADNFPGLVSILDEYASVAGHAVEVAGHAERRRGPESPQ